jgi:hypothetical protein
VIQESPSRSEKRQAEDSRPSARFDAPRDLAGWKRRRSSTLVVVALSIAVWALSWDLPALEDDKFWWIPQGLIELERGPTLFPTGDLPAALLPAGLAPPLQWTGGIPDYAHPPLFFLYLGSWYRAFGPGARSTHLALLPLAILLAIGTVRLGRRVADDREATCAAALLLATPPVIAQLARADLDLALIAITPWALEALLARRRLRFALLAGAAAWIKEPGVLLAAPALVQAAAGPRRSRSGSILAGLAPVAALGVWAALHRARTGWGLADPERLAPDLVSHMHDLGQVARFILWEQGRGVLTAAAVAMGVLMAMGRRSVARAPLLVLASHTAIHILFFGTINFLGGDPLRPAGSHLRYLLPSLPSLLVLGGAALAVLVPRGRATPAVLVPRGRATPVSEASRDGAGQVILDRHTPPAREGEHESRPVGGDGLPTWRRPDRWIRAVAWSVAALLAVLDWHRLPEGGVERNLYALDVARAEAMALPSLVEALGKGTPVWVGSYAWLDYVSPAVGLPGAPLASAARRSGQTPGAADRMRLEVYGQTTDPADRSRLEVYGQATDPADRSRLEVYGQATDPAEVPVGALVLEASHGEPLGRLSQQLLLEPVLKVRVHAAWVQLHRVVGRRPG